MFDDHVYQTKTRKICRECNQALVFGADPCPVTGEVICTTCLYGHFNDEQMDLGVAILEGVCERCGHKHAG